MIPVTKPFFPPFDEYAEYLRGIWEREWMTNNGPLVRKLEEELRSHLGLQNLIFVNNGTVALQLAIKALSLRGEIITTPFSFVATTSSIVWEECTPVFVDIDGETFNIDSKKIEAAITPKTTAILATHCFGNACAIDEIAAIASKHNLKVIYDAAHCFGTKYKGKSIFGYGDVATTSLHATKLFHTIEGGAVFSPDPELLQQLSRMRNFGHDGPEKFRGIGINGKNSEFHAAMGLSVLKYISEIAASRKMQYQEYLSLLAGLNVGHLKVEDGCEFNYAYFPVVFENEKVLAKVKSELEKNEISPRRYFYPTLSSLDYMPVKYETPVADSIAERILCLPLYHTLKNEELEKVCDIIKAALK
jgi:dTDP-4-amino-4,6-dideoxygalactose transaminase